MRVSGKEISSWISSLGRCGYKVALPLEWRCPTVPDTIKGSDHGSEKQSRKWQQHMRKSFGRGTQCMKIRWWFPAEASIDNMAWNGNWFPNMTANLDFGATKFREKKSCRDLNKSSKLIWTRCWRETIELSRNRQCCATMIWHHVDICRFLLPIPKFKHSSK